MNNLFYYYFIFAKIIIYIFCQLPVWDFKNSSIEILSSETYKYIIYDETKDGFHLKLEKYLEKKNGEIIQKNYIQKNNENKEEVGFEDINDFYIFENEVYICPKGNSYLYNYSSNIIERIEYNNKITGNWELSCYYFKNIIFLTYSNSDDGNIYALHLYDKKWELSNIHKGYLNILWPNKPIDENIFHIYTLLNIDNTLNLGTIEITVTDHIQSNCINLKSLNMDLINNQSSTFDEEKRLYLIIYNHYFIQGVFSNNAISGENNNIEFIHKALFVDYPHIHLLNANFIRNTKYIYYEIEYNDIINHGIYDIYNNIIVFNTNETIKEFKPITKYSLLAITSSSAFEICINEKYKGKCIDKCPPGQKIKYDSQIGNYCEGNLECQNFIFKNDNNCIDECNKDLYVILDRECGLCKHLNKSFPYKLLNESFCRDEKPENSYFINESLYLLNYCNDFCESCKGESNCLSCKDNKILFEGNCLENCPSGFYKNGDKNCSKCNDNCQTCEGGSENGNNNCLSCSDDLFLIDVKGLDKNCVSVCPNNTRLNNETKKCISLEQEEEEKKTKDKNNNMKWIIIIAIIALILIIIIIFVIKKYKNKDKVDEVNLVLKSDDDNYIYEQNESISQESED